MPSIWHSFLLFLAEPEPFRPDPFRAEWIVLLFLLVLGILTWVRTVYPLRLQMLMDCVGTPRYIRQVIRDESALRHPASWALLLVFLLTGGLFLYQCHLYYSWAFLPEERLKSFAVLLLILGGAILLKFFSFRLLRFLLGTDVGAHEQEFHLMLIFQALGVLLIPLTLFIAFLQKLPPAWGFGAVFSIIVFGYVLYLFRTLQIAGQRALPPFYIFLYLCTLEILPLIVMSKAFIDRI